MAVNLDFGKSQLDFSKLTKLEKVLEYFRSTPKPDLSKLSWVSSRMKEAKSYFRVDDHLIWSDFNLTSKQWISHLKKALDAADIKYVQRKLRSGQYSNDVFTIGSYSLMISCLRRGGRGILMCDATHVAYMMANDKQTREKSDARKKALNSLTPQQRKDLGV